MRVVALLLLLIGCQSDRPSEVSQEPETTQEAGPFGDPVGFLEAVSSVGDAPHDVAERARIRWRVTTEGEEPFDHLVLRGHGGVRGRFQPGPPLAGSVDAVALGIVGSPAAGTPVRDVASAVAEAVHARVEQRRVIVDQSPELTWRRAQGDCTEIADLTAAALRGLGIEARVAGGVAAAHGRLRYHAWVEYRDDGAWVGIDPTWDVFPLHAGFVVLDQARHTGELTRLEALIGRTQVSASE